MKFGPFESWLSLLPITVAAERKKGWKSFNVFLSLSLSLPLSTCRRERKKSFFFSPFGREMEVGGSVLTIGPFFRGFIGPQSALHPASICILLKDLYFVPIQHL